MKTSATNQADSSAHRRSDFIATSTATEAQYARLLPMLRVRNCNTIELRRAGVMMPAARIKELNERHGFNIVTIDRVDLWDEWGFLHPRVAVYSLTREPDDQRTQ